MISYKLLNAGDNCKLQTRAQGYVAQCSELPANFSKIHFWTFLMFIYPILSHKDYSAPYLGLATAKTSSCYFLFCLYLYFFNTYASLIYWSSLSVLLCSSKIHFFPIPLEEGKKIDDVIFIWTSNIHLITFTA